MIKNYIKIAYRNLIRQKTFSIINISGLAIGLVCFIQIMLWVQDELSYDNFHKNKMDIYRIINKGKDNSEYTVTPAPLAPALKEEAAEVINTARIVRLPKFGFRYGENSFYEDKGLCLDPSFFEIFDFPFINGDPKTALSEPSNIVITEKLAKKYFKNKDPINKLINVEGEGNLIVKGVLRNIPSNSHLQFDYVIPFKFMDIFPLYAMEWNDFNFLSYVQLATNRNESNFINKINAIAIKNGCNQIARLGVRFSIQPLADIYLHPIGKFDLPLGNIKNIYIFSLIACFILLIACFNYINLSTAKFTTRMKEVGMRKVVGAHRAQLVRQFCGEFLILALISLLVALVFLEIFQPVFNHISGKQLTLEYTNVKVILNLIVIIAIVALAVGIYPAIYLSSFQPSKILKNSLATSAKSPTLRKSLVVIQFTISIILIVCTITIHDQINYMRNKSWTLNQDYIVHFPVKKNISKNYDVVKYKLLRHPNIVAVTVKDCLPTTTINNTGSVYWEGKLEDDIYVQTSRIHYDYFKTLGQEIIEGRTFSEKFPSDSKSSYILNKEAIRRMKIDNPIGKIFTLYGKRGPIIGIVEDNYFQSLRNKVKPQLFHLLTDIPQQAFFGSVLVKISEKDGKNSLPDVIAHIKNVWIETNTHTPFEYHFLDDTIDSHYNSEQRLGKLVNFFSYIAILVSCLGLFGLALFSTEVRTKEIGIRKILGATISEITILLSKEFIKWVIVAHFIAFPISYLILSKWLQNYPYRVDLTILPFLYAGLLVYSIALFTISILTIKTATANPVDSLRAE